MIGGRLEARTSGGSLHRRNANDSDMIPAKPSGSKRDTGRFIKNPKPAHLKPAMIRRVSAEDGKSMGER